MTKKIEVQEERELRWPDGVDRTFIQLRKPNKSWKKSWKELVSSLAEELERLGATGSILICRSADERMDPGWRFGFRCKSKISDGSRD